MGFFCYRFSFMWNIHKIIWKWFGVRRSCACHVNLASLFDGVAHWLNTWCFFQEIGNEHVDNEFFFVLDTQNREIQWCELVTNYSPQKQESMPTFIAIWVSYFYIWVSLVHLSVCLIIVAQMKLCVSNFSSSLFNEFS